MKARGRALGRALAPALLALAAHAALPSTPVWATEPPLEAGAPEAAVGVPDPEALEPVEVTVEGDRAPPGARSLGRRDIREMPGVLGDPYRAVEIEPGVTPVASGVPYYFIRGAPPGNVRYTLDGVDVPLLFHVGAGPSVIPAPLVRGVDLHLGPVPASFGRVAGAVIDAESVPWRSDLHGEAAFRVIDAGGLVEAPLPDGAGSVLVGGHYALGAEILSAAVPQVDLRYGDYQGRVAVRTSATETLSALAFGSYDYLATVEDDEAEVLMDSDFHRLDVRYDVERASGTKLRTAVTLGRDESRGVGVRRARDLRLGARFLLTEPLGGALLRVGGDATLDDYDVTPGRLEQCTTFLCDSGVASSTERQLTEAFAVLFPDRVDLALGGFVDATIALGPGATITPGLRLDAFFSPVPASEMDPRLRGDGAAFAVDPRLAGRFEVARGLRLVPAVGLGSQLPGFAPVPAMQIGGIPGGLQRALQHSFGVEASLGPFELRGTGFRAVTFELTDAIGGERGGGFGVSRFLDRSLGESVGLELAARGALTSRVFLLGAYTLSRTTRTRDGITLPSAYDRTHVAQAALLFDLGSGWRAGARQLFYTGFPAEEVSPYRARVPDPERVKPFYRLDLRLGKRWVIGETSWIGLAADFQNALLAREIFDVTCDERGCEPRVIGPITIPTLALEAGF